MRHALTSLALLLLLAAPTRAEDPHTEALLVEIRAGLAAAEAGDCARHAAAMRNALELEPHHPWVLQQLATAQARCGELEGALATVDRLHAQGVPFGAGEGFDAEAFGDAAAAVRDRALALREPVGEAEALELPGPVGFFAEGIAWDDRRGRFLLSGTWPRRIVAWAPGDSAATGLLDSGEGGYLAGLGLLYDRERDTLWAVSAAFPPMVAWDDSLEGRTWLHRIDPGRGEILGRWAAPEDGRAHSFNDLCLGPAGEVYVGDQGAHMVHVLRPGSDALEPALPPDSARGANGICWDPTRQKLFVAAYGRGLVVGDPATGEARRVVAGPRHALVGIDGLYARDGKLLAVQNWGGLDRVVELRLDEAGGELLELRVLLAHHPGMQEPTTAARRGDELVLLARSQLDLLAGRDSPPAEGRLPPLLLRLPLD